MKSLVPLNNFLSQRNQLLRLDSDIYFCQVSPQLSRVAVLQVGLRLRAAAV